MRPSAARRSSGPDHGDSVTPTPAKCCQNVAYRRSEGATIRGRAPIPARSRPLQQHAHPAQERRTALSTAHDCQRSRRSTNIWTRVGRHCERPSNLICGCRWSSMSQARQSSAVLRPCSPRQTLRKTAQGQFLSGWKSRFALLKRRCSISQVSAFIQSVRRIFSRVCPMGAISEQARQ